MLADTHDRLPDAVLELSADADEIWHLGDVCAASLLESLRRIGPPVIVVRGNCDSHLEWALALDIVRSALRFRLVHIPPHRPPEDVDFLLHGHTHVPRDEMRGTVRFLNPGCVTRPNRGAPASVAWLSIDASGTLAWELVRLPR